MDKKDLMIALDEFEDRRSYYLDDKFRLKCYDLAIEALGKQIPKKPKIKPWNPASCPCCGVQLSESRGDGYYKHWTSLKVCECGQKLDWED